MNRKLIINNQLFNIMLDRLCQELIENHQDFQNSVFIGLQPKGIFVAKRIQQKLNNLLDKNIPLGYLDTTFYRDDFRRRDTILRANSTQIDFVIENKNVILIDDVLYTGRSVRAALDAMNAFGRPKKVELLIIINRKYTRDLPIEPNYIGQNVNTIHSQRVQVEWKEKDNTQQDSVWLVEK